MAAERPDAVLVEDISETVYAAGEQILSVDPIGFAEWAVSSGTIDATWEGDWYTLERAADKYRAWL